MVRIKEYWIPEIKHFEEVPEEYKHLDGRPLGFKFGGFCVYHRGYMVAKNLKYVALYRQNSFTIDYKSFSSLEHMERFMADEENEVIDYKCVDHAGFKLGHLWEVGIV